MVSFKLKLNLPRFSSIALLTKDAVEIVIVLFGVNNAVHFFLILGYS